MDRLYSLASYLFIRAANYLTALLQILGRLPFTVLIFSLQLILSLVDDKSGVNKIISKLGKKIFRAYRRSIYSLRKTLEHKAARPAIGLVLVSLAVIICGLAPAPVEGDFSESELPEITLSTAALEITTQQTIRTPLQTTLLTQGYRRGHEGLDLKGELGDPVYPVMRGTVVYVAYLRYAYGNHVIIDHGGGMQSLYAHLSRVRTHIGAEVEIDSVIGDVGSTGNSTGNHLHLEVIDQGRKINPLQIISGK